MGSGSPSHCGRTAAAINRIQIKTNSVRRVSLTHLLPALAESKEEMNGKNIVH